MLPLGLAVALSVRRWVPGGVALPVWGLLSVAALAQIDKILASLGVERRRAALLVTVVFAALFVWGTQRAYVSASIWYAHRGTADTTWEESERLLFAQADRIDGAAAQLRPGRPGHPDVACWIVVGPVAQR